MSSIVINISVIVVPFRNSFCFCAVFCFTVYIQYLSGVGVLLISYVEMFVPNGNLNCRHFYIAKYFHNAMEVIAIP